MINEKIPTSSFCEKLNHACVFICRILCILEILFDARDRYMVYESKIKVKFKLKFKYLTVFSRRFYANKHKIDIES